LPTPATPCIRMRGGVSAEVMRKDAREMAISGLRGGMGGQDRGGSGDADR
jgi:hypothetical protein